MKTVAATFFAHPDFHALRIGLSALVITVLGGCSTLTTRSNTDGVLASAAFPGARGEAAKANAEDEAAGDLTDSGADLNAIPLAVNRQVLKWIDYFQGVGRPHMERYLSRSTRYMPTMKAILREEGLPEDLIYIALIESGFS